MSVIAIPQILIDKFGKETTDALIGVLSKVEESAKEITLEVAENRFERRLSDFEAKIERRLSEFKTDLIKWMVGISIAQMGITLTVISILFAFFRR